MIENTRVMGGSRAAPYEDNPGRISAIHIIPTAASSGWCYIMNMSAAFEILPLRPFTQAEIWPIITGYETQEVYAVEKTESDLHARFDIRLVQVEAPFRATFFDDFNPEDCQWYLSLLAQGYSFGAYLHDQLVGDQLVADRLVADRLVADRLVAFALAEAFPEKRLLRVWEFHVMDGFRRMGIGRALMKQVIAKAREDHMSMIMLETQNTNVSAIRFYRSMGFSLHAIDCSQYFDLEGAEASQVAFFMKQKLEYS